MPLNIFQSKNAVRYIKVSTQKGINYFGVFHVSLLSPSWIWERAHLINPRPNHLPEPNQNSKPVGSGKQYKSLHEI